MKRTFSSPEEFQAARRRRLMLLAACALLLLVLAPAVHYFSLLGASDDPVIAGNLADDPDDYPSDGAGRISGPANGLASGWSKRPHDSMRVAGVLDARAEAIVTGESFDEWVALQPFRQTSTDDGENTEASNGDGQRVASLFAASFANLSDVFGDPIRSDFSLDNGFGMGGFRAGASGPANGGLRARRLVVSSTRDDGDTNVADNGGSPADGDGSGGAGNDGGGGNSTGVGFVPGGDLSGDPSDTNVSLVVTDPTDTGGTGGSSLPTNNAPDVPSVPEPTGLVLLGSGLVFAAQSLRARIARRPKQRLATR